MSKNKTNIYDIKELGVVPPTYGGVSVSIERLISKLTEDGFKVGGFYSKNNSNSTYLQSPFFEEDPNFSTKRILINYRKIRKILLQYKIIHSHYSLEHMIYIWCFHRLMRKKIVITIHNSMIKSFYENCDIINRFFLSKNAKEKEITWIAVSDQAKSELLNLPIKIEGKIHVIPAYIPYDEKNKKKPLKEDIRLYINRHKRIIVFYAHSFMLYKGEYIYGFNNALEVYKEILKVTKEKIGLIYCISEDKEIEQISALHKKAKLMNIDNLIFWQIGAIDNMQELWNLTDVYIRPTSTDGDSIAIREAIDAGVQVVASNVCHRPPTVLTYKYNDNDDFLNKILMGIKIGHQNKKKDLGNYNKIKKIYQSLLLKK